MFHSFFNSQPRPSYLSLFSHSFNFTLWSAETEKSSILIVFSFLLITIKASRLVEIRWSVCISKSQRCLCVSFPRTDTGLFIYHLFIWSNFNSSYNSRWITLPTQSCLVLYYYWATLLHFAYYVIDHFLSITTLPISCNFLASFLFSLWYGWLLWCFCAAIKTDLVSLMSFPFLSQVHDFTC